MPDHVGDDVWLADRCPEAAQPCGGELARHDEGIDVFGDATLPERQRGCVDDRLGHRSTAVVQYARCRVATVATGAVLAFGETHPDGAHEPILVQVGHYAGAGGASGGQRSPAEARTEVVDVDDSRAAVYTRLDGE